MKRMSLIFLLLLFGSCSQNLPEICEEKKPFFVAGKKNGPEWKCYPSGQWQKAIYWSQGIPEGRALQWYETGVLASDGLFAQEKGKITRYGEDGKKILEEHFVKDKRVGPKTVWYKNGNKQSESFFKKGELHGWAFEWYANGAKKSETKYDHDNAVGNAMVFYRSGGVWKITDYHWGKREKTTEYWSGKSGPKKSEDFYINRELYKVVLYDFFGRSVVTKEYDLPYTDLSTAKRTVTEYWASGNKMKSETYFRTKNHSNDDGFASIKYDGDQMLYLEDGKVAEVKKFRLGQKISEKNNYMGNVVSSSFDLKQRIEKLQTKRNKDIDAWRKEHAYLFVSEENQ